MNGTDKSTSSQDIHGKRIIPAFTRKYDGIHQIILTGEIDDYYLLTHSQRMDAGIFSLKNALLQYATWSKYDLIICFDERLEMSFATQEMGRLFQSLVLDTSKDMVENGIETTTFRPNENASSPQNLKNQDAQAASKSAQASQSQNRLDQITKALCHPELRVFVVFQHPEKMNNGNDQNGLARKYETIAKDWRDIQGKAHPDSRTVLIINPAREEEFIRQVKHISALNHMVYTMAIGAAEREEYMDYLRLVYLRRNHIAWNNSTLEQVVSAGMSRGNLYNFTSWIQEFCLDPKVNHLAEILRNENGESMESLDELLKKLDGMTGLKEVKKAIHDMVDLAQTDHDSFLNGNYTMLFLGNPGTGKTEIARLIGKMFHAMGLRRKPTVKQITMQSIQSGYNSGDVVVNMREAVKEAAGGVLFIDEVYQFAENDWARNAFDSILAAMYDMRKDLTVIMAGYEEKLPEIMQINPGFESRIPPRFRIKFPDYSADEKMQIFRYFMKERNPLFKITEEAERKLRPILKSVPGNARGVQNVFEETMAMLKGNITITEDLIHDPNELHLDEINQFLGELDNDFVGMAPLKKSLRSYLNRIITSIRHEKKTGKKSSITAPRLRFTGAPGTGKTTIARMLAKAFKALGLIDYPDTIEVAAVSLKGSVIGKAQENVRQMFENNKGKVLFLDEVYSLYNPSEGQNDSFCKEAVDTLVQCLTVPEYSRTALIVAGYKDQVDTFIEGANPGLKSRIPGEIDFPGYTAEECCLIFAQITEKEAWGIHDPDSFLPLLMRYFEKRVLEPDFANAREVNNVYSAVLNNASERLVQQNVALEDQEDDFYTEDLIPLCEAIGVSPVEGD